jgi:hypothetical protein
MSCLLHSVQPEISQGYLFLRTAKEVWDAAAQTYSKVVNAALKYDLKRRIHGLTQGNRSSLPSSQFVGEKMLGVGAPSRLMVSLVFGCPPLLSCSSEVGEFSRGGDFEGVGDFCFQILGVSHKGNAKGFWDLMSKIDEEHLQEFSISTPKCNGRREVKNLECSINYDVRGFGSSRVKAREPLLLCIVLWVLWADSC